MRNWRQIRTRLIMAGIPRPLEQLTLHALLDVTEGLLEEGKDTKELEKLRRELYKPEPGQRKVAGFTRRDEMASFQGMQGMLAGLKRGG